MTLRQSETMLRALVGLALGIGFVGFATHSHAERTEKMVHAAICEPVDSAATPIADVAHAGI